MNNGPIFFQTGIGRSFYENHVPRITKALESIAKSLEEQNNNKEKKKTKKDNKQIIKLNKNLKLKTYQSETDKKGLCIDIIKGDEIMPVLLIEENEGNVAVYLWEDKKDENFTYKGKIEI